MSSFFHSMVDFADKFTDLIRDQADWSQATFGSDSERGPMGALKHLEKEARECQEAVGTPELREELADCLLLLLDASRRAGIKPTQLIEAAQAKMVKNKQRTWSKPTSDEPVEHVR
jgi:NTP pyrophosphatase (non-canonical NTP hydrolase)